MYDLGMKFLKRVCADQQVMTWHLSKLGPEMFKGPEVPVYTWVAAHVKAFHVLPQIETLQAQFPVVQGVNCPEPSSYYLDHVEAAYYHGLINDANLGSQQLLKADQHDWQGALSVLKQAVQTLTMHRHRTRIMELKAEGPKAVVAEYHGVGKSENICQFGWDYLDHQSGGVGPGDVVSFVGRPAQGKAQPLTANVLTTTGWKTMGQLKVGDKLASVDGKPSEVTAIYPQGVRPVYEFVFGDGRKTQADGQHLWEVHYRDWGAPRILTSLQLIAKLKFTRYKGRLSVRLFTGEFGEKVEPPFSLYLLGVLLGDGGLTGKDVTLTSADEQILQRIGKELRFHGLNLTKVSGDPYGYRVVDERYGGSRGTNRVRDWLADLGLMGLGSSEKYIPEMYLHGNRSQRLELLQGLMDTDGTAGKDGTVLFCSTSKKLAEQVQYLCRSIGGKSRIRVKKTKHKDAYIVSMILENRAEVFGLDRKANRVRGKKTAHTNHLLRIEQITEVSAQECQCISVSHPDHLYVTDDFVVTHNTWMMLYIALHNWRRLKKRVMFVSMEMTPLAIAQRVTSMYAHQPFKQLKTSGFSSATYEKFIESMKQFKTEDQEFYVVDGNLAVGVDEIYDMADMLGCQMVVIDGAYLLSHPDLRIDRFTRVAENVRRIKRVSTELKLPTFCSWQFARSAVKGKHKDDQKKAGMEDIGMSDEIPQVSSVVLAMDQEESVETMLTRVIRMIKGRNGEIGQFKIQWLFDVMDFDQWQEPEKVAAMEHI